MTKWIVEWEKYLTDKAMEASKTKEAPFYPRFEGYITYKGWDDEISVDWADYIDGEWAVYDAYTHEPIYGFISDEDVVAIYVPSGKAPKLGSYPDPCDVRAETSNKGL